MIVSLSIAFFAGIISFISPCVLPLIPGYVSFICGTTLNELDLKSKKFILQKSLFFSLGFSLVFISLGATATFIGSFLLHNSQILSIISGIVIIFFGIYLLELIQINFLNKNFGNYNIKYSNNLFFSLYSWNRIWIWMDSLYWSNSWLDFSIRFNGKLDI